MGWATAKFKKEEYLEQIITGLDSDGRLCIQGVSVPAQPWLIAKLILQKLSPIFLIVLESEEKALNYELSLKSWLKLLSEGGSNEPPIVIFRFPGWDVIAQDHKLPSVDVISQRLHVLTFLIQRVPTQIGVIISSIQAICEKTLPPSYLQNCVYTLSIGQSLQMEQFIKWLESVGYEHEIKVSLPGEYAYRGGIVDVFPLTSPNPIRIEFFADQVESIREFDPQTQLSTLKRDKLLIGPAGELGLLRRWMNWISKSSNPFTNTSLMGYVPQSLCAYLPSETIIVFCEPEGILHKVSDLNQRALSCPELYMKFDSLTQIICEQKFRYIHVQSFPFGGNLLPTSKLINMDIMDLSGWGVSNIEKVQFEWINRQRGKLFEHAYRWLNEGYTLLISSHTQQELTRIKELWHEFGYELERIDTNRLILREASLMGGFVFREGKFAVITDVEVFGKKATPIHSLKSWSSSLSSTQIHFDELEPGDYVVHLNYGIGRFLGLSRLDGPDSEECLIIEYAPRKFGESPPRIYVPISQAYLVTKYIGCGSRPRIEKLNSVHWKRVKKQAEQGIKDFAAQLLKIQAIRATRTGFACPSDTPWQREFESTFPYEETPDQLLAIQATKKDMESPRPMDRLICGDAGFGKTEVALRAAFKMVMAGKQVAVLVPTTVLAHQHFRIFSQRMAMFPIKIELLSRFRSKQQQQQIIEGLASGAVDIVIGTHRLLSPDVQFRDLGLVIIDEEQRFGVEHKERLKQLRYEVDVLTLSATPIPRTLYLALAGARDISVIETPPRNRIPVQTIIAPYDERLIKEAIEHELARGGQVFYLHNRIVNLPSITCKLKNLLPDVVIEYVHGQMSSEILEETMTRFVNGDIQVLVCTTIIENGLDIPNANTIIIEGADRFGLAELYQLRGRVGRFDRQAYAYLLLHRHAKLLDTARKRLSAIRQYSAPGSGFKIALKDLEIRGAGNILGKEQSGHIAAIGFELYCKLLEQAIKQLKGESIPEPPKVRMMIDFLKFGGCPSNEQYTHAYIPPDYVPECSWRLDIYRRLAEAVEPGQIDLIEKELQDRFGPLPRPVKFLLEIYRLRFLAQEKGVTSIEIRDRKLMLIRGGDYLQLQGRFPRLEGSTPEQMLKELRMYLEALTPSFSKDISRQKNY